jgi:hypothetical protein
MSEQNRHDESAEGGALDPEGEGDREQGGMQDTPAEGSDEILEEEQQGKGYGAG